MRIKHEQILYTPWRIRWAEEELHICSHCELPDSLPLVFGYTSQEMDAAASRDEIHLGGCLCHSNERDHNWCCRSCGIEYNGRDRGHCAAARLNYREYGII
jgi:hypothetical protein